MDPQEDSEVRTAALFRAADEGLAPARILQVLSQIDNPRVAAFLAELARGSGEG